MPFTTSGVASDSALSSETSTSTSNFSHHHYHHHHHNPDQSVADPFLNLSSLMTNYHQQQQQLLLRSATSSSDALASAFFNTINCCTKNPLLMPNPAFAIGGGGGSFYPVPMHVPLITATNCGKSVAEQLQHQISSMMMAAMMVNGVEHVQQKSVGEQHQQHQMSKVLPTNDHSSQFVAAQPAQQQNLEQMVWKLLLAQQHMANTVVSRSTNDSNNSTNASYSTLPNQLLQQQLAYLRHGQAFRAQQHLISNTGAAVVDGCVAATSSAPVLEDSDCWSTTVLAPVAVEMVQKQETVVDCNNNNNNNNATGTTLDKMASSAIDQLESISRNKLGRSYNPGRPLGMLDRQKILSLYQKGLKISHIAKVIGVTHSCVSKIMTRYRRTGSIYPRSAQLIHRRPHLYQQHQSLPAGGAPITFLNDMDMADQEKLHGNNLFDENAIYPSAFRPPISAHILAADQRPSFSAFDQLGFPIDNQQMHTNKTRGSETEQHFGTELKHQYLVNRLLDC